MHPNLAIGLSYLMYSLTTVTFAVAPNQKLAGGRSTATVDIVSLQQLAIYH